MTANQKFSRFIGIDVSKAKLDIYDDATGEFLTVENTAKAIEKYVSALSPDPELLIVVDLTGGYEALCVNTFYNRGLPSTGRKGAGSKPLCVPTANTPKPTG